MRTCHGWNRILVRIREHRFLSNRDAHRADGCECRYCLALPPFLLGPIFQALGWNDSPFNIYPVKGRYMWRDLERVCDAEALPLKLPPARFPQNGLKAARLALVGEAEGWTPARAVFAANHAEQKDISGDATLAAILAGLGVNAERAFTAANAPENKQALKAQTEEAAARGLFGAP
jgi:2-hydroxychromene-2-carboxylate isomerase